MMYKSCECSLLTKTGRSVGRNDCATCTEPVRLESRCEKECETLLAGNRWIIASCRLLGSSTLYFWYIYARSPIQVTRTTHTHTIRERAITQDAHNSRVDRVHDRHTEYTRARTARPLFSSARSKASRIID